MFTDIAATTFSITDTLGSIQLYNFLCVEFSAWQIISTYIDFCIILVHPHHWGDVILGQLRHRKHKHCFSLHSDEEHCNLAQREFLREFWSMNVIVGR